MWIKVVVVDAIHDPPTHTSIFPLKHVKVPASTHASLFLARTCPPALEPKSKDCVFCLCFSLFDCNFSALSPILKTSIVQSHQSMHPANLCIEGYIPTSCWISTGPSALLTPWQHKIPCAQDDSQDWLKIVEGYTGYCNTLSLEGTFPKVRQISAMNYTRNHHTEIFKTVMRCFMHKIVSCWAFGVFCAQDNVALLKFYFFKDLSISIRPANFSIFKDFSRGWCFF